MIAGVECVPEKEDREGVNRGWGGMWSGKAAVSWVKREGQSISGKGSIMCKGPGAAGHRVRSQNCKRRGRRPGRWAGTARPGHQWEWAALDLIPRAARSHGEGFSWERKA